MRVVLLGGTGFFGSALKKALQARGVEVLSAGRGRSGAPDLRLDIIRNPAPLEATIREGDTVVYLVARSPLRRPIGGRRRYRNAHLTGVVNALQAIRGRATRFVYVSALGVHLGCEAGYAESKARAERIVGGAAISATVAAPSILFGRESEIVGALRLLSHLPVVPLPDLEAPFRPILCEEAAERLAEAILSREPPARLELTGPEKLTFPEVAEAYLRPRGVRTIRLPRTISRAIVAILSSIKLPWLPAELEGMLSIDNAGSPPERASSMTRFTEWARRGL